MVMTDEAATNEIMSALAVTREDIARAKVWLLQHACGQTRDLVEQWLSHQKLKVPKEVHTDLPTSKETLAEVARVFSVRLAVLPGHLGTCERKPVDPRRASRTLVGFG